MNDEMESSSEPENDSSDQLQATPILLGIMMITMITVKMKQWLRIFDDNDELGMVILYDLMVMMMMVIL